MGKIQISFLAVLTVSLFNSLACHQKSDPFSNKFSEGRITGMIQSTVLAEASGIVSSRSNPGHLWVINDSGNNPTLHLIDSSGQLVHTYWVEDEYNLDWEDIAISTDQNTGENIIYIADIGDNFAFRSNIRIITLQEPVYHETSDSIITPMSTYYFKYEDGPRDAETLLVDPVTLDLYVISKREENVRIYKSPDVLSSADTMELSFQASLPFYNVTAGDISAGGGEILLKNYDAIFYWSRASGATITETLAKPHEILRYTPEPQGESIAWDVYGKGYYTLSEKNALKDQMMYYYRRL